MIKEHCLKKRVEDFSIRLGEIDSDKGILSEGRIFDLGKISILELDFDRINTVVMELGINLGQPFEKHKWAAVADYETSDGQVLCTL